MSASSTHIIVFGASGRMGSRIIALARADPRFRVLAGVTREAPGVLQPSDEDAREPGSALLCSPVTMAALRGKNSVIIDFSSDEGTRAACRAAADLVAPLVVGTTALTEPTKAALRALSSRAAVLVAPNMSLGVAVMTRLTRLAAEALGTAFHCSIVETHHIKKKDAPSGTALRLADACREAGAMLPDDQILAIRGGDVIGEHTVRFAGAGEYLELTHRATSRDLFALGALRAASWIAAKPPGWYSIEDVVEFGS